MTKNWIAVNLVLLMAAALLGWQLYGSVTRFRVENDPSKISPVGDVKRKLTLDSGLPPLQPASRYNPEDFEVVSAKNLFAESRASEERTEEAPVVEAPALTVKPVLVGVVDMGQHSLAMIMDPSASDGRRRTQTKRLGDSIQGYTITEISSGRMVMESGSRREVIPLFDASKHPSPGGKTPIIATRVVNFGPAGGAGATAGRPTAMVVGPDSARPPAAAGAPSSRAAARSTQTSAQPSAAPQATPTPAVTRDAQGRRVIRTPFGEVAQPEGQEQTPANPNEMRDAQGRRIIRTPFGDVVRPEPPPNP
jgi:hypothetical protein